MNMKSHTLMYNVHGIFQFIYNNWWISKIFHSHSSIRTFFFIVWLEHYNVIYIVYIYAHKYLIVTIYRHDETPLRYCTCIVMHAQCQSFNDKKLKIGINISQILLYFVTLTQIWQDIAFAQNTRQKNSQIP